ncbi:MAG TPA: hypothetical protein DCQ50_00305 [Chryseobacterium sp.]|nr:hypothetical protein [Chryseobacterium sp.]
MKKNAHYLLLVIGMLLINAGIVIAHIYPVNDFLNGMLKGLGIVSLVAFIYYSIKFRKLKSA